MPNVQYIDSKMSFTVTCDEEHAATWPPSTRMMTALARFNGAVHLSSFDVWVPTSEPNKQKYTYRFIAKDGRRWQQTIYFDQADVSMTFAVADKWMVREFELHREIRDIAIAMIKDWRVTKIACTWS